MTQRTWQEYVNDRFEFHEATVGSHSIKHLQIEPGETMPLASLRTAFFAKHKKEDVVFPDGARFHRLEHASNGVWMTDQPIEQYQHELCLQDFHGDVLVGGLGLGLAVWQLSMLDDISSITVVEKSREVMELVLPSIHDVLDTADPEVNFECIHNDLFNYLEYGDNPEYDCAFYDIWSDSDDTAYWTMVKPLRDLSQDIDHITCWNEDVMKGQLWLALSTIVVVMLKGDSKIKSLYPSLGELCTDLSDSSRDWMVPFFRRLRGGEIHVGNYEREIISFIQGI